MHTTRGLKLATHYTVTVSVHCCERIMENRIMYFELKTGFEDSGPAWIGEASFSRTGTTVYFNNKHLKELRGSGQITTTLRPVNGIGFQESKRTGRTDIGLAMGKSSLTEK